jgi:hypothetical protein
MLDLSGLPALDLALGLAFIYFLLATLALTIQEALAALLGLRARTLEQGLRSMLEDPKAGWKYVDDFYDHALIRSLYRTPPPAVLTQGPPTPNPQATAPDLDERGRHACVARRNALHRIGAFFGRTKGPSYISPRAFAIVLLDNLAPTSEPKTIFPQSRQIADEVPDSLAARVRPLIESAQGDVERLRTNLEAWYDDTMARVSGWYKRKTQIILLAIGLVLVPALNANTLTMAERMWKDDAVRSAVVAQADALASATPSPEATPAPGSSLSASGQELADAADDVDSVVKIGIPMGWGDDAMPHGFLPALFGWLLTMVAISLGAPFWFDALGRISRIRSSGKPETPLPATGSGKANERILTPPQVPVENVVAPE